MNVLIVTAKMDRGGAETHVYELARFLALRGVGVTVASEGGELAARLGDIGIAHICLPLSSSNVFNVLLCAVKLKTLIKKENFQVVHAHTRAAAFAASIACNAARVPLVTTVHARYRGSRILDFVSRWGQAVIAVSYDLGHYICERGKNVFSENVYVIPNGIDTERFCAEERGGQGVKVVFASRLDGDCSDMAYALCKIARRLEARFENAEILICGGGTEYENIFAKAQQVNKSAGRELIRVLGHVSDMAEILKAADVFVGVSRAALEAMSCAVPVVLGGNEGFFGLVTRDKLDYCEATNFCCRGDKKPFADDLFNEVSKVLSKPFEERSALGEAMREYVVRRHSAVNMAEKTEQVYKRALKAYCSSDGGLLLCGYYGFGNMGDDALLLRAVERAEQKYPSLSVCAMTAGGKRDVGKFGIRCEKRSDIFKLIREIRRCDVIVFGGGTLLQNSTSQRSLYYYTRILRYARKKSKTVELWGNGIEPIKGKRSARETALALGACDYIGLRDGASVCEAKRLLNLISVPFPRICLEGDLALKPFCAERGRAEYVFSKLGLKEGDRYAVASVNGAYSEKELAKMKKWLYMLKKGGVKLVVAVMYPKCDMKRSRELCTELDAVLAYPLGISEVTELIRRSILVCSMRYHALVFAESVGVPFMGFGTETKVKNFCREHGGFEKML